jgi:hypothetical protein
MGLDALAAIRSRWLAEALLQATLEHLREMVPATFATLGETSGRSLLCAYCAYDDDLQHYVILNQPGCRGPIEGLQPLSLRGSVISILEKE